ncbi:MAG: ABC transporter permease subunit [Gammaproteobacteria bacterium]|nr:ABC transporter permease subunit [Gammaproteobacteria bacterium]
MKKSVEVLLFCLALGLVWLGVKLFFQVPDYFLPSPAAVFTSLIQNHALLAEAFCATFLEAILGFALALFLAFLLGFMAYLCPVFARLVHPLVIISQALPMLIIAPLIILWLGFGWSAKLTIIVLALFFPIFASFMAGLDQVKPLYLDLAATMNVHPFRLFRFVVFPASLPYLAAGLRVAITWAVLSALIAEWVGGSNGLGFVMQNALSRLDVALLFAALLILLLSTLLLYGAMSVLLSGLVFWKD